MNIKNIDRLTLTVADIDRAVHWYHEVFDCPIIDVAESRQAVRVGHQLIEFQSSASTPPVADVPTPGSADLALIATDELTDILAHLTNYAVPIVDGPVTKTGALGPMTAIDVRDLDGNLIEIGKYDQ